MTNLNTQCDLSKGFVLAMQLLPGKCQFHLKLDIMMPLSERAEDLSILKRPVAWRFKQNSRLALCAHSKIATQEHGHDLSFRMQDARKGE